MGFSPIPGPLCRPCPPWFSEAINPEATVSQELSLKGPGFQSPQILCFGANTQALSADICGFLPRTRLPAVQAVSSYPRNLRLSSAYLLACPPLPGAPQILSINCLSGLCLCQTLSRLPKEAGPSLSQSPRPCGLSPGTSGMAPDLRASKGWSRT